MNPLELSEDHFHAALGQFQNILFLENMNPS